MKSIIEYREQANGLQALSILIQRDRDDKGGRTLTEEQLDLLAEEFAKAANSIKELIS